MADIKQINLAGTTYNLVDDTAVHSVSATSALTTGITTGTITIDGTTTTFYDASSIVALRVSYTQWHWNTSNSDEANIAGLLQTAYNLYGSNDYYKNARELHIFNGAGGDYTVQLIVRFPNSWTFEDLSTASSDFPTGPFGLPNLSGQVYILQSFSNNTDDRYLLFSTYETSGEVGYKIIDLSNPGSSITATSALTTGITIGTITVDGVTTTFYAPSSSDTKVQQNAAITTAGSYPVMLGYNTGTTAVTNTLNKAALFTYNPSTKLLFTGAIGVTENTGWTDTVPNTTTGYTNGQIMFVVFNDED